MRNNSSFDMNKTSFKLSMSLQEYITISLWRLSLCSPRLDQDHLGFLQTLAILKQLFSESELLLVTRQNDNYSPGPGPGRLVPSSHQRSELSNIFFIVFISGKWELRSVT